jgi:FtsH-binding integral membrane protein
MYDMQLIIGGDDAEVQLQPDEYVLGAMLVYLNVIRVFWVILSIVGRK